MAPNGIPRSTILVTGGTGLVGRALQKVVNDNINNHQNEQWIFLSSQHGDLRNENDVRTIFAEHKPTHVIHLAAYVGGLYKNMSYPVQFWHNNVSMDDNITKLCYEYNVKKLISCLSTCIFPDDTTYPIDESMIHNGPPHSSNSAYAYAKRMIDVTNKAYAQQYGCNYTSVIPTNIYGPHDNFNLDESHVIPGLIHKLYLAKQNNMSDFVVYGTGAPLRQFIYSEDLARLFIWALYNYNSPEPIILSVDESDEVSIRDVVNSIVKASGFTGNIIYDTSKSDGQYKKTASNRKLRSLYPGFQFTPLYDGIKKSVEWFEKNYDSARK